MNHLFLYPAGGVPCQGGYPAGGVPCWGVPCQGGYPAGGIPCRGGLGLGLGLVSKLQLSSSAVSWPYIALCPMELWVMLQSIMGKKKNYGMGTPPPRWPDRLMDRHVSKHYPPVVLRTRAVNIMSQTDGQRHREGR